MPLLIQKLQLLLNNNHANYLPLGGSFLNEKKLETDVSSFLILT